MFSTNTIYIYIIQEEVWTDSSTCEGEPTKVTTFTDGCFKKGTNNFQKWVSIDSNTIKRNKSCWNKTCFI